MNIAPVLRRINKLPKWARDYIHDIETFAGTPELHQKLDFLREQNKQLMKLIGELRTERQRLKRRLGA